MMSNLSNRDTTEKKPYHPPRLVLYGDVQQLTKTGGTMSPNRDKVIGAQPNRTH